jgi:PAS domain S-box-containing protein
MNNSDSSYNNEDIYKVLELSPLGAFQTDMQGNCFFVNKQWENISGRPMQESLGRKWLKMVVEEDLPIIHNILRTSANEQKEICDFTYRILHPRKGIRYCKVHAKFVFDAKGAGLYFLGYIEDVTITKRKTEYIKLQNELLAILKNIQDQFYFNSASSDLFYTLLKDILKITKSADGYILELPGMPESTSEVFKILASSDNSYFKEDKHFCAFTNIKSVLNDLGEKDKSFIIQTNPLANKTCTNSFIVLPAKINGQIVGLIGLANRVGGYEEVKINFFEPLLTTFANLIVFQRLTNEKKAIDEEQKKLTIHLQTLITSLEDIIFELDGNKIFKNVWVNNEDVLFMPKEKFIGKSIAEVFGEQAKMFIDPLDNVLRTGEVYEFEYKHLDKTMDKWYKAKITPFIKSQNLAEYKLVFAIQDVTERTKQNLALQEAKENLARSNFLLDVTQEISKVTGWEFDLRSRNIFMTKQATQLYEVDQTFIPTLENTFSFFETSGKEEVEQRMFKALRERLPYKIELPIITASQNRKWVRAIGVPVVKKDEVVGLRGATLDITEEKEFELTLVKIKEKLEKSNTDKDRIMQVLAHDLRSPLSGINTLASMLLQNKKFSEKTREILELIHDSSLSAHNMIRDLIEAILDNKKETLKKSNTELPALMKQCVGLLALKATEKSQKICLKTPDSLSIALDQQKIMRVLNNLITNAIKFSPNHAIIKVQVVTINNTVRISVEDMGIGIPDELKEHVFDMFTISKRYGTSGEEPFGLGLSICKQIVEAHNGAIWFNSQANVGSTFFIDLPIN